MDPVGNWSPDSAVELRVEEPELSNTVGPGHSAVPISDRASKVMLMLSGQVM